MERKHCRGHKGGAAFICNITGWCPFAGEASDLNKIATNGPISASKLKSPVAKEKAKPRGIHVKRSSTKKGAESKN